MPIGEPTMPTPEEQAKLEKSRTISDAELLKDGAWYVINEDGEKILKVNDYQIAELAEKERIVLVKKAIKIFVEHGILRFDKDGCSQVRQVSTTKFQEACDEVKKFGVEVNTYPAPGGFVYMSELLDEFVIDQQRFYPKLYK